MQVILWIGNYTYSGWDDPKAYRYIPYSDNSEVPGIEWLVPVICMSCAARAKESTTHMVTAYKSWCQW